MVIIQNIFTDPKVLLYYTDILQKGGGMELRPLPNEWCYSRLMTHPFSDFVGTFSLQLSKRLVFFLNVNTGTGHCASAHAQMRSGHPLEEPLTPSEVACPASTM